jgi:ABC-type transport system involved in multi-copper enzyme maturation permease subunit
MVRGRTVWVAWIFALLPIAFTIALAQSGRGAPADQLFGPLVMLIGVLAPLFMASSMAEEIEDRTFTYLWSRPVPRWTVVVGKLLAAGPLSGGILAFSVAACYAFADSGAIADLLRAVIAAFAGAFAICGVSAGLALIAPRAGLGATYAYLLALDLPVGAIPFSIRNLSVTHQIRQIAGVSGAGDEAWIAALWLFGVGGLWLAIGLWRLSGAEYSASAR